MGVFRESTVKPRLSEDYLQYKLAEWLRENDYLFFHVPNGGGRDKREAARLKSMGVRAGVHDLVILLDGGKTIFVELKVKGGRQSKTQKNFHDALTKVSHQSHLLVADSVDDGIEQLAKILAPR